MAIFDLNNPPQIEEGGEDGAGHGGEDGGSRSPPPDALVLGSRARGAADAVVLGGRRLPPLGMAGRPRGGFICTTGNTTTGLPPLGLVRRPRVLYTASIGDAATDTPPSGLLGRTMPSFTIGTAGSEPVAPVRRVSLSRRPRGGGTGEAGSSRGGGSNRARGAACSRLPRGGASTRLAMGASSNVDQQEHAGNTAMNIVQAPTRNYGRPPRGRKGRGSRGRGSGTSHTHGVEESGEDLGYAGGFDTNYT
ncbi:hypothetical protein ZWY2020_051473 [Hordeum vulgare]|nr:hypothetical protein ZWY2020_051473 [Hordeum vulgare]